MRSVGCDVPLSRIDARSCITCLRSFFFVRGSRRMSDGMIPEAWIMSQNATATRAIRSL